MLVLSAGAPGVKTPVLRIRRNVGILLLEFGSLRNSWLLGPVPNLSSVIYPQAVGNYGSLGVCGLLPGELAQRAPGKLDHAIGHLPWSTLFVGVWEFQRRQKRLWCVRLGRKPRYILVHPLLQTSHARHFVVVILVPIRYLSYYVSTLLIPT